MKYVISIVETIAHRVTVDVDEDGVEQYAEELLEDYNEGKLVGKLDGERLEIFTQVDKA